jgi:hypothetical protein
MAFSSGAIREVKPLSFIYEMERALPPDVCLEAIRRFEASPEHQVAGRIGPAGAEAPEVKRSTDLRVSGREDWRDIDQTLSRQLVSAFNEFAREFPLQGVSIRPAQGKLILFPPFWTHVHRGVTLETGVKYIATTWICFA